MPKRIVPVRSGLTRAIVTLMLLFSLGLPGGSAASAQDSVDLWAAWGDWSGKNAETFAGGYALGMSYVADVGWPADLGLDVLFARLDANQLTRVVDEFEASVVLRRWILGQRARIRPFVGARGGYTRLSADFEDLKFEQNGVMGGPTLGFVFPTGKTLSPMISVEALRIHYQDTSLFLEGVKLPQSGGSAWRFFARVGVTFGSGWERRGR